MWQRPFLFVSTCVFKKILGKILLKFSLLTISQLTPPITPAPRRAGRGFGLFPEAGGGVRSPQLEQVMDSLWSVLVSLSQAAANQTVTTANRREGDVQG